MPDSPFEEFVRRNAEKAAEPAVDWNAARDAWLGRLRELYARIEEYLSPFVNSGSIKLSYHKLQLREERIGTYTVDALTIALGTQQIRMTPVGTLLIGAAGRVDIEGPKGETRLVLVPKEREQPGFSITIRSEAQGHAEEASQPSVEPEWTWKFATSAPHIRYTTLTKENFEAALMQVAGG